MVTNVPQNAVKLKKWSDTAIKAASHLTVTQRQKIVEAGAIDLDWPIHIKATRVNDVESSSLPNSDDTQEVIVKNIHFQRHGQGYHNLLGNMYRELGNQIDMESKDPQKNPFIRPEIVDSPLTELGREESAAWREDASKLNPELVVVSPMCRAVQTAMIAFVDHRDRVPWVAHEGCREDLGVLVCNKRRCLSEIKNEFPFLDFSFVESGEEDSLWDPDDKECPVEKAKRVYAFLTDFIMKRSEREIAVIGHSGWLFNMCNAVIDCGDDENLKSWFLTSEIKSMRITFSKKK